MFYNKKIQNAVLQKKKKKKKKKKKNKKKKKKKKKKEKKQRILNYKPISLRSKDVLLSLVIFNLIFN